MVIMLDGTLNNSEVVKNKSVVMGVYKLGKEEKLRHCVRGKLT